jgi:hypothetical protein
MTVEGHQAESGGRPTDPGQFLRPGVDLRADNIDQGLAKLVLTVIELIRRLLEAEALRRMDAGGLTDDEIERLGTTFERLEERLDELKTLFGLADEDLNIDLGPLGNLM